MQSSSSSSSFGFTKLSIMGGPRGFTLYGADLNGHTGYSVASAGDVNGDGISDVIVSGRKAGDENATGEAYVVYGSASIRSLDLSELDGRSTGFTISGGLGEGVFESVGSAGDFDGDGASEVVVGVPKAGGTSGDNSGAAYVVHGKKHTPFVTSISLGWRHSCVHLGNDLSVRCWGLNLEGQLGQGDVEPRGLSAGDTLALSDVNVGAGCSVRTLSAGSSFTCALLDDGSVKCWGRNSEGQLGIGSTGNVGDDSDDIGHLDVADIGDDVHASSVSAGFTHVCVVTTTKAVKCWGDNSYGQLGIGGFSDW